MTIMLRYDRQLQRVWVANVRLHHGTVGLLLVVLGSALAVHDRADVRVWLKVERWSA